MNAEYGMAYPAAVNNQMLAKFQYYHQGIFTGEIWFNETFSQDVNAIKPLKTSTLLKLVWRGGELDIQSTL